MAFVWIKPNALLRLHAASIDRFGGTHGVRDMRLLESTLARAENLYLYEPQTTVSQYAGTYGFGIAKNHAFIDGNKRASFAAMGLFLSANGYRLSTKFEQEYPVIYGIASGATSRDELAAWLRKNITPSAGDIFSPKAKI